MPDRGIREINEAGLDLIKRAEGEVLHVYPDPGTHGRPYTAGVGHAGKDVQSMKIGDPITQQQSDDWLRQDLAGTCKAVDSFAQGISLTDNQFAALVSFAFNVGGWRQTPLFRYIRDNRLGDAAEEFHKYDHAAGKVLAGLTKRRAAEKALFNS